MIFKFTLNYAQTTLNICLEVGIVWTTFEKVLQNSVKNSMFSGLFHISLITFQKIFQLIQGYIWTIWNSLQSVLRFLKKIQRVVPRKIPFFPDCVISAELRFQRLSISYKAISRPFGTVWNYFEKVPRSVPWFPEHFI